MKYLIYKITNKANGKFYIGAHASSDFNDDYWGSGVAIKRAVRLYGKDNFTKEVLFEYPTRETMFEAEAAIVNQSMVDDRNSYNMCLGGLGSRGHKMTEAGKEKLRAIRTGTKATDETRAKMSRDRSGHCSCLGLWKGKHHSEESKAKMRMAAFGRVLSEESRRKISIAKKGKNTGSASYMYGRHLSAATKFKLSSANISVPELLALEIKRDLLINHLSIVKCAEKHGVGAKVVFNIKSGRTWKNLAV